MIRRFVSNSRIAAALKISPQSVRRVWLTATDQGVASISNFAVTALVGRITGPAGLGAFALAYTCWILLINLHRSLITDPMAIMGDARDAEVADRIRHGFAAELVLAILAMIVLLIVGALLLVAHQHLFGLGVLAVAPWVIALNLQDYWRWIGFLVGKPEKSLVNDLLFDAVQAGAFVVVIVLHISSVFAVVAAWGVGATAAALYGLHQFSVRPTISTGLDLLGTRWKLSRWLVSTAIVNWGSSSLNLVAVAAFLGPAAVGGFKAGTALAWSPLAVVIQAGTSFGLPEASRMLAARGLRGLQKVSRLVSGATTAIAVVSGVVVFFMGHFLLRLLYGSAFSQFWLVTVLLSLSFVFNALGLGPHLSLKALAKVRSIFTVQIATTALMLLSTIAFTYLWGVDGAAGATILPAVAALGIMFVMLRPSRYVAQHVAVQPRFSG